MLSGTRRRAIPIEIEFVLDASTKHKWHLFSSQVITAFSAFSNFTH